MLAPAVATAAAITLWFAVDRRAAQDVVLERSSQQPPAAVSAPAATAPSAPAANEKAVGQDREAAPSADAAGRLAKARTRREADTPAAPTAIGGTAAPGRQTLADTSAAPKPQAAPVEPRVAARSEQETQTQTARTQSAASSLRPATEAPPPATIVQQQAPPPPAPQQQGQQQAAGNRADRSPPNEPLRDAKPAEGAAAGRGGAGGGGRGGAAAPARTAEMFEVARRGVESFDVASPDTLVRWRVSAGRIVQHSRDGGINWVNQHRITDQESRRYLDALSRSNAEESPILTAGIAPSTTVVWLVGRSGFVLLATDGKTWHRVKFPETVDLIGVSATDARTATVTSADGRTFSTANGGASWAVR
jgi:hypothetical protein